VKNSRGFSLLEIALALAVVAGSLVVIASAWSGNFGRIQHSQVLTNVSLLLQKKLTELEAKYNGRRTTEISDEAGDFGSEFSQYRWTFEVQPFQMPDLSSMIIKSQGGASDMLLSIMNQFQEVASKAVVEGRVTIFYKTPKKELSYSATTYFVDFEQDIGFGGGGAQGGSSGGRPR
jgi:hypothetical protein